MADLYASLRRSVTSGVARSGVARIGVDGAVRNAARERGEHARVVAQVEALARRLPPAAVVPTEVAASAVAIESAA